MSNSNIISNKIKELLKLKKISQAQMLRDCELNPNIINQMSDKKGITCYNLLKIADYLGVSMDYLMGRTENPEVNK